MDIIEKAKELNLPLEFTEKIGATLSEIDLFKAHKISDYLKEYDVKITKISEVRYYLCDAEEINNILTRLQWCRENGQGVLDDKGNNKDLVFNSDEFFKLYPNADLNGIIPDIFRDRKTIREDMLEVLDSSKEIGLTEDNYDKYVDLESKLTYVMQAYNGSGEIDPKVTDNLIKLLSNNVAYPDKDILYAALVYKQNRNETDLQKISVLITQVLESLNQGGTLNI